MKNNKFIEDALANGYDFNISNYILRGINMFKKNPGGYIAYTLLYIIISLTITFIPILGILIRITVNPALKVGTPITAHIQEKYSYYEFGNFFKGFEHITQLLIANIITNVFNFIFLTLLFIIFDFTVIVSLFIGNLETISEYYDQITTMGLGLLVIGILFIYVVISFRWTNYLIVFHQYDAVSAIKTSWALTNKKWIFHLAFALLAGLMLLAGVIALFVGIIFVIPIIFAADYAGYADVTGLNRNDDVIDEIGIETDLV